MKTFQFGFGYSLFQSFIFEFGNFSARSTYHVMVGFIVIRTLVLRSIAKLVLDNQSGINQEYDCVIKSSTTYTEFLFLSHIRIQHIYIEMSFYGIDSVEYSITLGCLPMPVLLKIIRQNLFCLIFYILFHPVIRSGFKVNLFCVI